MKPLLRVAIVLAAFVGAAAPASADPSNVLNKLEVQKLVAMDSDVADLALAVHFNAVADRYLVEAARHRATGAVYRAHANRSATTNAGTHSDRLAELATEWAVKARELATYHVTLAVGRRAVLPDGAAALHSGRGAPEPNADQLHKLALTARTRADHLVLVEYYGGVARKKTADAAHHRQSATGLRAHGHKTGYDPAVTHERLASIASQEARRAIEAADRHRQLAYVA